jgi:hypothetical protein
MGVFDAGDEGEQVLVVETITHMVVVERVGDDGGFMKRLGVRDGEIGEGEWGVCAYKEESIFCDYLLWRK